MFDLPVDWPEFQELLGKYVKDGTIGTPGVYLLINKNDGNCYVGSSLSLVTHIKGGYFRVPKGKRSIDVIIKEFGLSGFKLEVYVIPSFLLESFDVHSDHGKIRLRDLVLTLEQLWILRLNPIYNDLKVASSRAGITLVKGTLSYDEKSKKLIISWKVGV